MHAFKLAVCMNCKATCTCALTVYEAHFICKLWYPVQNAIAGVKQHCDINAGFAELLAQGCKGLCRNACAIFQMLTLDSGHTLQLSDLLSETEWTPAVPA